MKNKILIANRGEIAVRIIRACKELGIPSVSVYSLGDENSLHVKLADEAICIGPASSKESYLNINRILSAAIATGCNAIHPGYGFLAENQEFVELVEKCNLTFIGPSFETMQLIGDKASARKIAKGVNVPIIEGSDGSVDNLAEAIKIAKKIGYPVILKASSGGGGRGITIVKNQEELSANFIKTSLEASANFGDEKLYLERFIENPRHVEIQIMADKKGNVVSLLERDCSIQRRNQKMIEESPSTILNEVLRRKMSSAAIRFSKAIKYTNAGTLEFLVDNKENFYFIEMNTRIQVEHPVTEMLIGIDLIKEQIKIAYGKELSFKQRDIKPRGHVIECRINAENPFKNFIPTPGEIKNAIFPGGPGIRLDTHIYPSYSVPPFYDSLLAKLIVIAPTRMEAIKKMRLALEQFIIDGIKTNIEYQYLIMHNVDFIKGYYDTGFIERFNSLVDGDLYE